MAFNAHYSLIRSLTDWRRRRCLRARLAASPLRRLVIGAGGKRRYQGWEHTDRNLLNILKRRDWLRLGPVDYFDAILAEHVWEHLTLEEGLIGARLCCEFLKPGGFLRIAVPDGGNPDKNYIERVRPGGYGPGAHDHKVLYDYRTLVALLKQAGFESRLLEYYDENGALHTEAWSPEDGPIMRASNTDPRNKNGIVVFSSLLIDAFKPALS